MSFVKAMRFKGRLAHLLVALIVVCAPYISFAQQASQSAEKLKSRPLAPKQFIPSRDFDTRHIALDLQFDWEREQAMGTASITFAPLSSKLSQVTFDAANMTFSSVRLSTGEALNFVSDTQHEKLIINLDKAYQPFDLLTVVIAYHTNGPTSTSKIGLGGLTFIKPTQDEPNKPRQIWSQGESQWNHQWFPCFDYPNDFATSELTATVDKPLTVISNGRLVDRKSSPNGKETFHWRMDEPHASYLTSIVVGEFATIQQSYRGIPITSYVYANQVEQGKVTTARVPQMMQFFEERTGVMYPNAKYAQSFVYGFGGGMENITATTMSDQTIHDERSELDRNEDGLLAHELAHSWFGNNLTARSWSDLWLNESFATYLAAMWTEHNRGHDDFLYLNIRGDHAGYLNAWSKGVRRPIVTNNFVHPDALFDVYAYARGSAVLHMLRKLLGDDQWWRAMNYYLRRYSHRPVETEEFRIAIEEATGQPLESFFDQWVYRMGHPVFRVTQSYDRATNQLVLKIRQEQQLDNESAYPQAKFFEMPVEIEIGTSTKTRVERVALEAREEQTITFDEDSEPLLVNFDYGDTLIKELIFEKPIEALIYQLKNDPDVTGRIWALEQLSKLRKLDSTSQADKASAISAISDVIKSDKFWGVRESAAFALSDTPGEKVRLVLLDSLNDLSARVRTAAVNALATSRDSSLASTYVRLLNDKSYATIRAAAIALGAIKSDVAYLALRQLTTIESWNDVILASALDGLAAMGDQRALELGLRFAVGSNRKPVRLAALTLLGAVGKKDPRVFPIVSNAFSQAVSSGSTSTTDATARALVELGDPRAIEVFQLAKNRTSRPEVKFLISQFEQQLLQKKTGQ